METIPINEDELLERLELFSDRIKRYIRTFFDPYLEDSGLRAHHISFITSIHRNKGISQKELRNHLPYDKSRISTVVAELEAMGIVVNLSGHRSTSLALTEKGEAIYTSFLEKAQEFNANIFDGVDHEDMPAFIRCMRVIDANLESGVNDTKQSF